MEDENGLELSLGLSCGGLSVKSKGKNGSSSDARTEEGDKGNKLVDDFKNFLHAGTQKQDSSTGSQRNDSIKVQENFFNDLSKNNTEGDSSMNLNGRGVWAANSNKSAEMEDEKRREAGSKRKMLFDEINHQKKQERDAHADLHDKTRTSHISITTEDGSTAENEDVAESEVEGSTSKLVSQHDDGPKRFFGVGGSSEVSKEVRGFADSSVVDLNGQKRFNSTSENEFKLGNMPYGVPFSLQSVNMMNVPYSLHVKESNSIGVPSMSGQQPPGMMQVMPSASSDRSGAQSVNPGNLPLMFGYAPVQLPLLDKDNSWGLFSQPQQFHPSYAGRGPPNSEATQYDGRTLERAKGDGKQHGPEEGSSSQVEEDVKGSSTNLRAKDASDRSTADAFSLNFSAIKPGIAADVKFGGCGSYPNLPWVSTIGPNGRTISGVTYRYSPNEIRIVCACHGSHMSPEEFVRHAGGEEHVNPENGTNGVTVPNSNPSASAQS
ncbi:ninja-family protein mc410 isoform X2 [Corylus avellana]|uniref:ninja-family protein mc410 isoform X2 n=1 Tax=Corylus avellana TaxID=13451 RepID=UPI00286D2DAB|nr:ninja-family protein mc410 isoform X2 [Corylus avellana]